MTITVKKGYALELGRCNSCGSSDAVFEILMLNAHSQGSSVRLCAQCLSEVFKEVSRLGYTVYKNHKAHQYR